RPRPHLPRVGDVDPLEVVRRAQLVPQPRDLLRRAPAAGDRVPPPREPPRQRAAEPAGGPRDHHELSRLLGHRHASPGRWWTPARPMRAGIATGGSRGLPCYPKRGGTVKRPARGIAMSSAWPRNPLSSKTTGFSRRPPGPARGPGDPPGRPPSPI